MNAEAQDDIGDFDKVKGVKWEPQDEAKFADWDFTHPDRFYDEVIESLEWARDCAVFFVPPLAGVLQRRWRVSRVDD